jgi:hypothetical protein
MSTKANARDMHVDDYLALNARDPQEAARIARAVMAEPGMTAAEYEAKTTVGDFLRMARDPAAQEVRRLLDAYVGPSESSQSLAAARAVGAQIAEAMARMSLRARSSFREHHASSLHSGYGRHTSAQSTLIASMERLVARTAPPSRTERDNTVAAGGHAGSPASLLSSMDKLLAGTPTASVGVRFAP